MLVDSSLFIAFTLDTDLNHQKAARSFHPSLKTTCTTEDIIKETLTVISQRKGRLFAIEFFQGISQDIAILPVGTTRFQAGLQLFLNPKLQKDISLIDCTTAAICKELRIQRILSFDPHFRAFGLTIVP